MLVREVLDLSDANHTVLSAKHPHDKSFTKRTSLANGSFLSAALPTALAYPLSASVRAPRMCCLALSSAVCRSLVIASRTSCVGL